MLSQKNIQQFHDDGYTALRQSLTAAQLDALRAETDRWVERSRQLSASSAQIELDTGHTADEPRLRRLKHPVALSPVYWNAATGPAILDAVEALLGSDLKFHHSKLNMKAAKGGAEVGWHQDFAFFPHTNDDMVAVGIALDDAMAENGCLLVIPGTHRLGLLSHRDPRNRFVGKLTEPHPQVNPARAVPVELKAGDVSFHHVSVVHGSTANTSGRQRRLFICQYAATDAIPLDYRPPENEFTNAIVRGAPLTHARMHDGHRVRLRSEIDANASIFARQNAGAP